MIPRLEKTVRLANAVLITGHIIDTYVQDSGRKLRRIAAAIVAVPAAVGVVAALVAVPVLVMVLAVDGVIQAENETHVQR